MNKKKKIDKSMFKMSPEELQNHLRCRSVSFKNKKDYLRREKYKKLYSDED